MYSTGNPVPSDKLEDLSDDGKVFDTLVTQTEGTTTDRLGRTRRVFQQILMDMGFQPLAGSFHTGATITARNQCLQDTSTGTFYSWSGVIQEGGYVVPAGSTPTTAGGVGALLWVDRTDVMLRSDLAATTGAGLVGTTDGITVQAKLNAIDSVMKGRVGTGGGLSFRNKIVDGRFDFWYEGTSQTSSGYGSSTMWNNSNGGSTKTTSQQPLVAGVDLPAIEVPSAKYFSRTVVSSVAGAASTCLIWQNIEDVATLAGKTVTLSFYAKADSVKNIAIDIGQFFGAGGSATVAPAIGQLVKLSTTWKRYSITGTLPSISGKTVGTASVVGVDIWFDAGTNWTSRASSLGQQSGTFDIACVQLEEGSVMTPFEELPMEISQTRLSRYYWSTYPYGTVNGTAAIYSPFWTKNYNTTDAFQFVASIQHPVEMRATPACTVFSSQTGNSGKTYNQYSSTDVAVVCIPTKMGVQVNINNTVPSAAPEYHFHFVADARL